jgi:GxxExxY protein
MVDADDADPSVSAARELREETGYEVEEIIHLGSVAPNPAFLNNRCHSYLALGVRPVHEVALDGAEDIAFEEVPLSAIPDLIRAGAITHSLTITAFHYLSLYEEQKKLTQRTQSALRAPRELGIEWTDVAGEEQKLTQRTPSALRAPREGDDHVERGEEQERLSRRAQNALSTPRAQIENVGHTENDIAAQIVDAAFHIHRAIGPGLLESAYEALLSHELQQRGFRVARQVLLPVRYGDVEVDAGYRIDLLVDDKVVVELKSVEALSMIHSKQLLTYLRFADKRLGLLVNFGDAVFKHAIKRVVNGL